ncbi:butyrophilin subfamily 1 member A1-like [Cebus imitator]|uniref:butyrophilin subfamily 1 member A1-like n=1 Tax=Cebus imitator TaxID=2715852 RepID=UPI00189AD0C9|nr:butyrophilin subfamily 1 member A1-like [Cebus imitator]
MALDTGDTNTQLWDLWHEGTGGRSLSSPGWGVPGHNTHDLSPQHSWLLESSPATFSRSSGFTAWKAALPLVLVAVGLLTAGGLCIFWKRQREKNKRRLEEDRERREEKQQPPAGSDETEPWRVSPKLDPDTASPKLSLSEDGRSVWRLLFPQDLPPGPERFEPEPCVLGRERFWTGRHRWEVEVGGRQAWVLGVCVEGLPRKGRVPKAPRHGVWALELYRGRCRALSFPRTRLQLAQPLRRVAVTLDCHASSISFHSGADGSLLYTFSGLAPGPLRPFFCLWTHDSCPLIICPVGRETRKDSADSGDLWLSPGNSSGGDTTSPIDKDTPRARLTFSPSPVQLREERPAPKSQQDCV